MKNIKTEIESIKQDYNFFGEMEKSSKDKEKNKNLGRKGEKLVIFKKFKSMLTDDAIKLLSDIKNYTNTHTLKCQLCLKEIPDNGTSDYCHLYTDGYRIQCVTIHFLCALKQEKLDMFEEIMGKMDYIYYVDD